MTDKSQTTKPFIDDVLLDAVWQVLDDMGTTGLSCCLKAKAKLRIAYEAYAGTQDEMSDFMPLEDAKKIVEETNA